MRVLKFAILFVLVVFLAPMALAGGWWLSIDRPSSWRSADWSPTGILPDADVSDDAAIYVLSARTGGLKGAFAVHSWIVLETAGADHYVRYDKVGWGNPVRENAYRPDGLWYSNRPWIVAALTGKEAAEAMPKVRQAIASYPYGHRGDYRIWPGPNSNSFVAHVLREVPELDAVLPPNAVGRDYLGESRFFAIDRDRREVHLSAFGLIGISAGVRSGFEFQLLGQAAGIEFNPPALKLPAVGRVGF